MTKKSCRCTPERKDQRSSHFLKDDALSWLTMTSIAGCGFNSSRSSPFSSGLHLPFVLALVIAFNLAAFLGRDVNLVWGLTVGALAGIGWVAASFGITYLFERQSTKLFLVNSGYQAVTYIVMGGILGVRK